MLGLASFHLPHKLQGVFFAQSDLFVVGFCLLEFREHILVPGDFSMWIAIQQGTGDVEHGDHLFHFFWDNQGVRFSWRFEHIISFLCHPLMFQILPAPFQHVSMDGTDVSMPGQHASLLHTQQVDVVSLRDVEAKRSKGHARRLRHPHLLVGGRPSFWQPDLALRFRRHRLLVWHEVVFAARGGASASKAHRHVACDVGGGSTRRGFAAGVHGHARVDAVLPCELHRAIDVDAAAMLRRMPWWQLYARIT
mmetsp:Transcript_8339/g.51987  ORF Transcript_8339/g.51987 Transcript_8339/m.51987 type:complete len:250 (+) Transcript_8339:2229-2978(+)